MRRIAARKRIKKTVTKFNYFSKSKSFRNSRWKIGASRDALGTTFTAVDGPSIELEEKTYVVTCHSGHGELGTLPRNEAHNLRDKHLEKYPLDDVSVDGEQ